MFQPTPPNIDQLVIDAVTLAINNAIAAVNTANNNVISLTKDERSEGVTVGPNRKAGEDYYFENKNTYPGLKPSQTKVTEVQADKHYFIHTKFSAPEQLVNTLMEKIQDIRLNSEHFAFHYANAGRNAVHEGQKNGLDGADAFGDALDAVWPDMGPKPEPTV